MTKTAEYIAQSTRHLREAEERIVRQEIWITRLRQGDHDTRYAEALLRSLYEALRTLRDHAEELRQKSANELREKNA
jgi:hypothetical protein